VIILNNDQHLYYVMVLAAHRAAAISNYPYTGAPRRGLPTGVQVAATRQGNGPAGAPRRGPDGAGRSRRVGSLVSSDRTGQAQGSLLTEDMAT
jgi:hypothetical protein